jgi:hypothetical protein
MQQFHSSETLHAIAANCPARVKVIRSGSGKVLFPIVAKVSFPGKKSARVPPLKMEVVIDYVRDKHGNRTPEDLGTITLNYLMPDGSRKRTVYEYGHAEWLWAHVLVMEFGPTRKAIVHFMTKLFDDLARHWAMQSSRAVKH